VAATAVTVNYDALLSTTLFNYRKTIEDNISTSNFYFYALTQEEDGYEGVEDLGDRSQIPLMYELGNADTYSGYDTLGVAPIDGITSAFFEWRQLAIPISISGIEELKNSGEARITSLLKAKTKQAVMGIQEKWAKMLLQGEAVNTNTAGNIETGYVSPSNGSLGVDPLFLFIKKDPTTATTVGSISQSTETWWRNRSTESTAANYAAFKKELRKMYNDCSKGPGGPPNVHLTDQSTSEYYEEVLSASHRNPSYQKADIPFDHVGFKGKPMVWDEFMPNVEDRTTTQVTTKGTWAMINTKMVKMKYHKSRNFTPGPFEKPINQDAKVAHVLWVGSHCVSNRRKLGVLWGIDTTVTS
jgi:hypothetical protein